MILEAAEGRSCGACRACCKTHPVREINKPARVWCTHCDMRIGCRIYSERPYGCRTWVCQWLAGFGDVRGRPDHVKVVTDFVAYDSIGKTIVLYELSPGGLEHSYARQVCAFMAPRMPVLTIPVRGNPELMIPRALGALGIYQVFALEDGRTVNINYV